MSDRYNTFSTLSFSDWTQVLIFLTSRGCKVTKLRRHMPGHVRTKSADSEIYRIWASFFASWNMFLHCMQHNMCLSISKSHLQLPRGQDHGKGHTESHMPWAVSLARFSSYIFKCHQHRHHCLEKKRMPYSESAPTN